MGWFLEFGERKIRRGWRIGCDWLANERKEEWLGCKVVRFRIWCKLVDAKRNYKNVNSQSLTFSMLPPPNPFLYTFWALICIFTPSILISISIISIPFHLSFLSFFLPLPFYCSNINSTSTTQFLKNNMGGTHTIWELW